MLKSWLWPVLLGASALLASCEQSQPGRENPDDEVLPSTETFKDFGNHIVHFSALNTDQLAPEIAQEYGIVRSKNRAMLTVSIHAKQESGLAAPVSASISASAVNLTGQLKRMPLREIKEGEAIYYVGALAINNGETLVYTIDATPANTDTPLRLRFKRQFFTE